MDTKTKLVWLELLGGIFGWMWIIATVAALYCLGAAVFSDMAWSRFFAAVAASVIAKWMAKGIRDNQIRVGFVADLMAKGLSREEASKEWFERYSRNKL